MRWTAATPARRRCLRDEVREALLGRILEGSLRPGDRIVELQLAREFRTSQGPVREALRELEALRVLETTPFRGTRVRPVTPEEIAQAAEVRGLLEELAARQLPRPEPGWLKRLARELDLLEDAARRGDLRSYARHNYNFHRMIVEAARNQPLLQAWEVLAIEVNTLLTLSRGHGTVQRVLREHRPILQALQRGDRARAARLLRKHARSVVQMVLAGRSAAAAQPDRVSEE
jgi:DNA-binding GntR family transcriptional regulator